MSSNRDEGKANQKSTILLDEIKAGNAMRWKSEIANTLSKGSGFINEDTPFSFGSKVKFFGFYEAGPSRIKGKRSMPRKRPTKSRRKLKPRDLSLVVIEAVNKPGIMKSFV